MDHPNHSLIALGIRQPWVELILRREKTIEVRSVETTLRGTIYLYASLRLDNGTESTEAARRCGLQVPHLPLGAIVGTVEIVDCRPCQSSDSRNSLVPARELTGKFAWVLRNPTRLEPLTPRFRPFGIWFYPFQRKNGSHG